jgi:hypothetical protein
MTMRFGTWRGMPLAIAAALALGLVVPGGAQADGLLFQCTIPRTVEAYDYTTGQQYQALPIPYGHYAKDYIADAHKALGCVSCRLHALVGGGGPGHGLFHHGDGTGGDGSACGHKHGHGAGACGSGIIGHGGGSSCGVAGCGGGGRCKHFGSHGGAGGYACTGTLPTSQAAVQPSAQASCGQAGCTIRSRHFHGGGIGHNSGCGICGGADPGCGHGHGFGHGTGCAYCGGAGCNHCLGSGHGSLHGMLASLAAGLNRPKTSWFLGPGGPVPLTPGYVPYIVTTRSPREFFAFAPMNPYDR